jgi:hypothetical protein
VPVVAAREGVERVSFQERVERSRAGRVLISLFVVATLLIVLTANLPASHLQSLLMRFDHPYLNGVDMSQNWGVFAPDPRQQTVHIYARVDFADGSQETWQIPARNAVVGEYVDYRWRKWEEWIAQPSYPFLYQPGAIFVARQLATPERRPVRVTLFDRSHPITPPGQPSIPAPAASAPRGFYTTRITEAMLQGTDG